MNELIEEHEDEFGFPPVIIGTTIGNRGDLARLILDSIENGNPYDEYKALTKEDQVLYDKGMLVF